MQLILAKIFYLYHVSFKTLKTIVEIIALLNYFFFLDSNVLISNDQSGSYYKFILST